MAKVMLVEDDNNLREIYEARLQAEGYSITSAKDGEEALVVAKAEKPDLIVSDVMMPKISGFEMLDILRNTEGLRDTKVIMLTALGQADDRTRADSLGADRYLVKSQVTLEDIVKAAHELLEPAAPTTPSTAAAAAELNQPAPAPAAPAPQIDVATPPTVVPDIAVASEPAAEPAVAPAPAAPTTEPTVATPATPVTPEPAATPAATPSPATPVTPEPASEPAAVSTPTPEPAAPAPTAAPATELTPAGLEASADAKVESSSSVEEQKEVASQIESFIESQTSTPEAAAPSSDEANTETMNAAVADMVASVGDQGEAAPDSAPAAPAVVMPDTPSTAAASNEPKLSTDVTAVEVPPSVAETVPSGPTLPKKPYIKADDSAADTDAVAIAHKKVITPINDPTAKPDLNELLAQEEAKNIVASSTPSLSDGPALATTTNPAIPEEGPAIVTPQPGNTFSPTTSPEESVASSNTEPAAPAEPKKDGFDPNSISL